MEDNTSGESPENSNPLEAPAESEQPEAKTVSWEDFNRVERANSWAQGQVRTLTKELEALRSSMATKTVENPQKQSQLKAAEETINQYKSQVEQLNNQLRNVTVKTSVQNALAEKLAPGSFEAFWKIEGEKFDRVKDEATGQERVVLKDSPWLTLDEYAGKLANEMPWFVRSTVAQGAGVPKPNQQGESEMQSLPRGFDNWSFEQKRAFFEKHPEAAKFIRVSL